MTRVESLWFFTTSDFTLSTMSVTSSSTPGMVVNSCCALRTLIWVTALPSRLESSTRRKLLPIVVPKPRSNGSAVNLPYVPESDVASTLTRLGSSKPRHRICIKLLRCGHLSLHAPPLGRATTVVRNGRHIFDRLDRH